MKNLHYSLYTHIQTYKRGKLRAQSNDWKEWTHSYSSMRETPRRMKIRKSDRVTKRTPCVCDAMHGISRYWTMHWPHSSQLWLWHGWLVSPPPRRMDLKWTSQKEPGMQQGSGASCLRDKPLHLAEWHVWPLALCFFSPKNGCSSSLYHRIDTLLESFR